MVPVTKRRRVTYVEFTRLQDKEFGLLLVTSSDGALPLTIFSCVSVRWQDARKQNSQQQDRLPIPASCPACACNVS